ncbi:MAG: sec-independent protein translocase protein TatB [Frankiales bacterium]|jgi:sec-independent protein translocase protein TatB|nr:sec-independent protein translocase protein TatB [Frankiales bacterium]
MFHIGFGEVAVIAVIALFVVGPERLPKLAADAGRLLRQFRMMARNASASVKEELGPDFAEVRFEDLNPRTFVRRHLLDDLDDDTGLPPTSAAAHELREEPRPLAVGERPPYDSDAT